jgi:hypothetical protein
MNANTRAKKLERLFIAAAFEPRTNKEFDHKPEALRTEFWQLHRRLPHSAPALWERFKKRMERTGRLSEGTSWRYE